MAIAEIEQDFLSDTGIRLQNLMNVVIKKRSVTALFRVSARAYNIAAMDVLDYLNTPLKGNQNEQTWGTLLDLVPDETLEYFVSTEVVSEKVHTRLHDMGKLVIPQLMEYQAFSAPTMPFE